MDCNQIKVFINLEITGEEDKNKNKKKIIYIFLILKNFCNLVKPLGAITVSRPNFYYIIIYDIYIYHILREFQKLVMDSKNFKNTPNLIK